MLLTALAVALGFGTATASAATGTTESRYTLVKGCFALEPAGGGLVAQTGNGYSASAGSIGGAEPFRMQATDLGKYLFFGRAEDFLSLETGPLAGEGVVAAMDPSGGADWTVEGRNGSFTIVNEAAGRALAVSGSGEVVSVPAGQAKPFTFRPAEGCAVYPEVELNTSGEPTTGSPPYGEVTGLVDSHMHMMAFEFLGGQAHCGQPWHKFGAPAALQDCPDHTMSDGCGAVLETALGGQACHDPVGWPTFNDWPAPESLTHESSYYRWLERAHQGGLRVFTNLLVENRELCELYPDMEATHGEPKNDCNEMESVLLQAKRLNQLQDYIDAQEGGPGEGWFRIAPTPFKARKLINKGKLAVVMGMEVSEPFNCGLIGVDDGAAPETVDPRCTKQGISGWLDRLHDLGVRQIEITNKFDNALTGVAGDGGTTGVAVNSAQFRSSSSFWKFGQCEDPDNHDRVPLDGGAPVSQDEIFGKGLEALGADPPVLIPIYTDQQQCNKKGLSPLGEHAINEAIDRQMIFDPDHMSVKARNQALNLVEERDYPGIISSHSWSTPNALPRIYRLGGMITPYAGNSTTFVDEWERLKEPDVRSAAGDQYFGIGYGADGNGFGSQGSPRNPAPDEAVTYPFESFDGNVTFDKQVSGVREFDINKDGVAHYGLYPDWTEDLRQIAGDEIVEDMGRGAEAYLQMWERAYGIPEVDCTAWDNREFNPRGLGSALRLNKKPKRTLRQGGQPVERSKTWRWCAGEGRNSEEAVTAGFSKRNKMNYIVSNLSTHEISGVGPGSREKKLRRVGTRISSSGVWLSRTDKRRANVWIVGDDGRVSHAGVVTQAFAQKRGKLARKLTRVAG